MEKQLNIQNRKARYEYLILQKYVAGIQLSGTEIKSIRQGNAHINEAYCMIRKDELYIVGMHIAEYEYGSHTNHKPDRIRKLLLTKRELKQIHKKIKEKGLTVVPLKLFLSARGFAKLEIALAQGKKVHDKRTSIKERDVRRDMDREIRMI